MRLFGILLMFSTAFVSGPSLAAGGSITSIVVSSEKAEKKVTAIGDKENRDKEEAAAESSIEPVEGAVGPAAIASPPKKASSAGGSVFDF